VHRKDVAAALICTPNHLLAPIALEALKHGKHILVEKPAGIRLEEVEELALTAQAANLKARVGFNHRYHPAFLKAREIFDSGILGPLMHIRARYGHGGRTGYDSEWRANPSLSGGGELIDQGVHLIDLSRWFLGEFASVEGHATTSFWDMEVDDNAFLSLRTAVGQTAWLHASCTEWKNLFSFEIFGRDGVSVREVWGEDDPRAFLGITVPRFPNFFMLYGPGTNLAHGGSAMFHSECQVRYIMQAIREVVESGARSIEIREDRCAAYNEFLDATHERMVWTHPGVGSWYKNKAGRVVTNSPFRLVDYRRMTENLDPGDYLIA
jgi:predicted dehydrogenase